MSIITTILPKKITLSSNNIAFRCAKYFSTIKLSDEEILLQNTCREFAKNELAPIAGDLDKSALFPKNLLAKLFKLGFMGICVEPKYNGSGLSTLALSLAVEELSKGCASTGSLVSIHNALYVNLLQRVGSDSQKDTFLRPFTQEKVGVFALSETAAGSDVSAIQTTAKIDGDHWILNGRKSWVTSACEGEVGIVFATMNLNLKHKGITAFIVPLTAPGVSVGPREDKMGIRATSTCDLVLDNVRIHSDNVVGEIGGGFHLAMEQLNQARIGISSQALGIAQAALDIAIQYASQRIVFDKPILNMQTVQLRLAEMALKIEAARLITRNAAVLYDSELNSTKWCSLAKIAASECANFATNNCVQILGGMGFVTTFPAERHYRDAKITEIYAGITDVQKVVVAKQLIKEYGYKL